MNQRPRKEPIHETEHLGHKILIYETAVYPCGGSCYYKGVTDIRMDKITIESRTAANVMIKLKEAIELWK